MGTIEQIVEEIRIKYLSGKSATEINKIITGLDEYCVWVENHIEHESTFRKNDPDVVVCKIYEHTMKMRGLSARSMP